MKRDKGRMNKLTSVVLTLGTVMGMLGVSAPLMQAYANTSDLSVTPSTLQYGYSGPLTIQVQGSGVNFNGTSNVFVTDSNGTSYPVSSTQVSSATQLSFSLGSNLPSGTYSVKVVTMDNNLTETDTGTMSISAPTGSDSPASLLTGYTDGTQVQVSTSGFALSSSTDVQINGTSSSDSSISGSTYILSKSAQNNIETISLKSGLPAGTYEFKLSDSSSSFTVPFTITNPTSLSMTTNSLPSATIGQYYPSVTLFANEGNVTWTATGLPQWLILSGNKIELASGVTKVPSDAATTSITIHAADGSGNTADKSFTLTVNTAGSSSSGHTSSGGQTSSGSSGGSSSHDRDSGGSSGSTSSGSQSTSGSTTGNTGSTSNAQPPSYPTVVSAQQVSNQGGKIATTVAGSAVSLDIPANAFQSAQTVQLTTENTSSLEASVPTGTQPLMAIGVNFSGLAPSAPVTLTITNPEIPANAQVYKQLANGSLSPVAATVTAGKVVIQFSSDPNFVIVMPKASSSSGSKTVHLKSWQREIVFGDTTSVVPAEVQHGTTYVPIWYVMQTLKSVGVTSTWNGHVWAMASTQSADISHLPSRHGSAYISLNGHPVEYVAGAPGKDPFSGHATSYMPIWYVMQVMNRLGIQSTWDGTTWTLTK